LKAAAALDDVVWIETFDVPQLYNMMGDYGGQIQTLLEGRGYTVRAYGSSGVRQRHCQPRRAPGRGPARRGQHDGL
jgi:hypothetical protein